MMAIRCCNRFVGGPLTTVCLCWLVLGISLPGWLSPGGARISVAQEAASERPDFDGISLPSNRTDTRGIKRAQESIAQEEFSQAVRYLDEILARDEDSFLRVGHSGEFFGLKETAWKIIRDLPESGRQAYETTFGPAAGRLLKQCLIEGDYEGLRKLTQRYFHSPAGHEAALLLAQYNADLGRHLSAALTYQELLDAPAAVARFEPQLSLHAALSWTALGNRKRASELLQALGAAKYRSVRIGAEDVLLDFSNPGFLDKLLRKTGLPANKDSIPESQWLTSRGNPQRNGQTEGGLPHLRVDWQVRLLAHPVLETTFQEISASRLNHHQPLIPAASPLAVGNFLITRSAHNLVAIDFTTGKRVWQAQQQKFDAFAKLIDGGNEEEGQVGVAPARAFAQRVWEDYLYNTISSDGQKVFVIRDLKTPTSHRYDSWQLRIRPNAMVDNLLAGTNRLCAYDLETQGKLVWEVDGAARQDEMKGAFFLGAPLAIGQSLYCLVENNSERAIYLVALERQTGKLQWRQQLANLESGILIDSKRRLQAAIPSYDEGILVCPTGVGAVVGIDLAKNALSWAYRYSTNNSFSKHMHDARAQEPARQWLDAAVTLAEGRVLLTPPESDSMHCIELATGALLWKKERKDGVFVAGIDGGNVLIVGPKSISAVRLLDGKQAWDKTRLAFPAGSSPTGRGFLSHGRYYLPMSTAEVFAIDTALGEYVGRVVSREGRPLGNLICHRGAVVSQSGYLLDRYGQIEVLREAAEQKLLVEPGDSHSLRTLGEIAFNNNELDQAIQWLLNAYSMDPADLQTREVLSECLQVALDEEFVKYRRHLPLFEEVQGPSDNEQLTLLRLQAKGMLDVGDMLGAFDICVKMSERVDAREIVMRLGQHHQVALPRWIQEQVSTIWQQADGQQREQIGSKLEAMVADLVREESNSKSEYFLQCFASLGMCEPLMMQVAIEHFKQSRLLDAQQLLIHLSSSRNQAIRGEAIARSSQILHQANLPQLAISFDKQLSTTFADLPCIDGMTGEQCLNQWAQKSGFGVSRWPYGKVDISREASSNAVRRQGKRPSYAVVQLERSDEVLGNCNVFLGHNNREILIRDSLGMEIFRSTLDQPSNRHVYGANFSHGVSCGNLLLVSSGKHYLAFNTLHQTQDGRPHLLWRKQAISNLENRPEYYSRPTGGGPQRAGSRRARRAQREGNWVGVIGPTTYDSCVLLDQTRLVCVDPLTGKVHWQRTDVPVGCDLFGDGDFVFAVERAAKKAFVFSTIDGRRLEDVPVPIWRERLATHGRNIIRWRRLAKQEFELSSIDALKNEVSWQYIFDKSSSIDIANSRYVVVVDSKGHCTLIDAFTSETLVETNLQVLASIQEIHLLAGNENFVLAIEQPMGVHATQHKVIPFNQTDYVKMDGMIFVFNRATGMPAFVRPATVKQQVFALSQPVDLPVIAFAGNLPKQTGGGRKNFMRLLLLEKSSGRQLYRNDDLPLSNNYFAMRADDSRANEIVVEMVEAEVRLNFTGKARPPEPPSLHEVRSQRGGGQGLLGIGKKFVPWD